MRMRAEPSGISLTGTDAAIIKGMLLRGDRQHDIAAWFGVNGGRIATPDDLLKAKVQKARNYARSKFGHMTDDQAIRVADFIREMLKESAE